MENELQTFLNGLSDIVNEGSTKGMERIVEISDGKKFIKVITAYANDSQHRSVYAFIAKDEGYNKSVGYYKQGDVLKPASWNAPVGFSRGNLFDNQNGLGCAGKYGLAYLR